MRLPFNGVMWITSSELKRKHLKVLCIKITAAEIHFYAFSLWNHKALYSRSMKKCNYNINVIRQKSEQRAGK